MEAPPKSPVVELLLRKERSLLPSLFLLPFKNALMKGAAMDEEAVAYVKKIRLVGVIICAIFLFNAIAAPFIGDNRVTAHIFIAIFMAVCGVVMQIAFIGYQHRDLVPVNKVAMFDLNVAKSGGLWGAAGLGLWSLFKLFFTS